MPHKGLRPPAQGSPDEIGTTLGIMGCIQCYPKGLRQSAGRAAATPDTVTNVIHRRQKRDPNSGPSFVLTDVDNFGVVAFQSTPLPG